MSKDYYFSHFKIPVKLIYNIDNRLKKINYGYATLAFRKPFDQSTTINDFAGIAFCSSKDKFCKKKGRELAIAALEAKKFTVPKMQLNPNLNINSQLFEIFIAVIKSNNIPIWAKENFRKNKFWQLNKSLKLKPVDIQFYHPPFQNIKW